MDPQYLNVHRQARRRRLFLLCVRWAPIIVSGASFLGALAYVTYPHA